MTANQTKTLLVTIGLALVGVVESLKQQDVLPHQWAWALDLVLIGGGYLKGAALQKRPGDVKA